MPAEDVAKLRNVVIVGQGGAGKTTVADALLFAAGASTRLGRVEDGSSAFDTEPEEARRIGRAARERIRKEFLGTRQLIRYLDLLKRLLG